MHDSHSPRNGKGSVRVQRAGAAHPANLVERRDAIFNIPRAVLLLSSVTSGRFDLLAEAMRDRLHQPWRGALLRGLDEALAMPYTALSGAGSSVIVVEPGDPNAVADCLARHGHECRVLRLEVDRLGRRVHET